MFVLSFSIALLFTFSLYYKNLTDSNFIYRQHFLAFFLQRSKSDEQMNEKLLALVLILTLARIVFILGKIPQAKLKYPNI